MNIIGDDEFGPVPEDHPDAQAIDLLGPQTPAFTLAYLRASPDCVILLNPQGRITFMSENGREAMEFDHLRDVVGRPWWEMWPEDGAGTVERAVAAGAEGRMMRFQGDCPTAKGTSKTWDVTLSPIVNNDGRTESLLAVCREI